MSPSNLPHLAVAELSRGFDQFEQLSQFGRKLDSYSDLDQLLRSVPADLGNFVRFDIAVLIQANEGILSLSGADGEGLTIGSVDNISSWHDEVHHLLSENAEPFLVSLPGHLIEFPRMTQFFLSRGNKSLCLLPLKCGSCFLGVLCFGRKTHDAFSEIEMVFLSLIANLLALAVNDRLNSIRAESMRAQLESQRTKLQLILELNSRVGSTLELREVLRSISPSIRKTMRLDGVAVILPDPAKRMLQLYELDFPKGDGSLHPAVPNSIDGSVASQVFRTGRPWVGDIEELTASGLENGAISAIGIETLCMLPLTRCNNIFGVLCLVRLRRHAFTQEDVEFLSQVAGQVAIAIDNALAYRRITELSDKLTQEKLYLEDEIRNELNFEEIIGNSPVLRRVLRQVEAVAPTSSTVLIQGETGSGKELIARAVHNFSLRRSHPFVKLNCAAIPTGLLESELFGHEKGAFTGAIAQRIGRFELSSQGTIFLDEVSEIPLELQPKLLRVLQEREFERLGSSRTLRTDARLIAATNQDLEGMVEEQKFRRDLFYRLNVFPIFVPPLRERREDIPFLVRHFAQHFARSMSKNIDTISAESMNALVSYPWPGNIRELQNVIERAVILSGGTELKVSLSDLKSRASESNGHLNGAGTLEEIERSHILSILEQTNWVFGGPNGAAARLGMKRPTLQFRMQKLGISRPQKS